MAHEHYRERREVRDESPNETPTVVTERRVYEEAPPVAGPPSYVEPRVYRTFAHQVNRIIWYLFTLLEGLLGLRVVLRAIGANPESPFAAFIYSITAPFVAPFATLVDNPTYDSAVFEITTIVAMLVYLLLAYAVTRLVHIVGDRVYDG